MNLDPFVVRLLVAVLIYFFFDLVIKNFVSDANAQKLFSLILLVGCILFIVAGAFLPIGR